MNTLTEVATSLQARSRTVDDTILREFHRTLAPAAPAGLALVAVGGYGREELFPCSDVDLLILVDRLPEPGPRKDALSTFLRDLWDHGLRVSQSVRTPDDCCQLHENNLELSISLLDWRFLGGDGGLRGPFEEALRKFFARHRRPLRDRLAQLTRQRHARFQRTTHHLEPDLKDGPGGIRDAHVLRWLGRLQPASPTGALEAAWPFLAALRIALHEANQRDQNRLTFELQDRLAAGWEPPVSPEELMRLYHAHARRVFRAAQSALEAVERDQPSLLNSFRDWRSRLSTSEFSVLRDRVFLRSPGALEMDPGLAPRLFQFVARHGLALDWSAEERVTQAPRAPNWTWAHLSPLLAQPNAALALRAMDGTGVLGAVLPEWVHVQCLVVRDYYHRYTVDEHTLVALDVVDRLARQGATNDAGPERRFADLMREIPSPAALRLALLFHDVGKGMGGDHELASRDLARGAMDRLGVPAEVRAEVLFLVEQHVALSHLMTTRDLEDPATARRIADLVGTVERLKALTVLTFADVSAVHPEAMTAWRREQLWRAYLAGHEELTRELDTRRVSSQEVPAELAGFVVGLPGRYLLTHSPAEMLAHARLAEQTVAVDFQRRESATHVTVIAPDRPGLFAALAGTLSSFGLEIVQAEAYRNRKGQVLDMFAFVDPHRTLDQNPEERDRLQRMLARAAMGEVDVAKLLAGRKAPKPGVSHRPASVSFDNSASDTATLVQVSTADRPGLLYGLAEAIASAGCSIEVVLVDTQGRRALDVFYLTESGEKLTEARQEELRPVLLARC